MQRMGKESITLSMELAKTQCYVFECFEDNYSLSARRDVGLTQGGLIPKEHSLYRVLKHSVCQHKLDLTWEKNLVRQKNSLGTCIPFDIRF